MGIANTLPEYNRKKFTLNTGAALPAIGLGTFQDPDEQLATVSTALKLGYRHIDTAHNYGTETQIGEAIRRTGVPRHNIILTTKLWCNAHHPDDVEGALDASLADLGVEYVDLYLMHYPCAFKCGKELMPVDANGRLIPENIPIIDTWRAMERLVRTGKVRAIGVSNFSQAEMEIILNHGSVVPAVHQMELHPYLQQPQFAAWHRGHGIQIIQFSPCGNMNDFYREVSWGKEVAQMTRLIDHPDLAKVAKKHGKSSVQTALAWAVSQGRAVIPKTTIEWQLRENLEAEFDLDGEDCRIIATMDRKARFNDPSPDFGYRLYVGLDGADNRQSSL